MMEVINDLPDDILGVAVRGHISQQDYHTVLVPATLEKLSRHRTLGLLMVMGDVEGYEPGAMKEDLHYGVTHRKDFSHVALVMRKGGLQTLAKFFLYFFPGEVQFFKPNEVEKARAWLVRARPVVTEPLSRDG